MGVRSLSIMVELERLNLLIDAGAALGPRSGLPPHPLEYVELKRAKERIRNAAKTADVIFVSHYHYDHYTPAWPEMEWKWTWSGYEEAKKIYDGKHVWAKNITSLINKSQMLRAMRFVRDLRGMVKGFTSFNEGKMVLKDVEFRFKAFKHGTSDSRLGYVLSLYIEEDTSLLYMSDVQGPGTLEALAYIKGLMPNFCIISGPPIYLSDLKIPEEEVGRGIKNLIITTRYVKNLLVDHHMLRSEESLKMLDLLKKEARKYANSVYTFAEFLGINNNLLEARRKELYRKHPPSQEFLRWTSIPRRPPPL